MGKNKQGTQASRKAAKAALRASKKAPPPSAVSDTLIPAEEDILPVNSISTPPLENVGDEGISKDILDSHIRTGKPMVIAKPTATEIENINFPNRNKEIPDSPSADETKHDVPVTSTAALQTLINANPLDFAHNLQDNSLPSEFKVYDSDEGATPIIFTEIKAKLEKKPVAVAVKMTAGGRKKVKKQSKKKPVVEEPKPVETAPAQDEQRRREVASGMQAILGFFNAALYARRGQNEQIGGGDGIPDDERIQEIESEDEEGVMLENGVQDDFEKDADGDIVMRDYESDYAAEDVTTAEVLTGKKKNKKKARKGKKTSTDTEVLPVGEKSAVGLDLPSDTAGDIADSAEKTPIVANDESSSNKSSSSTPESALKDEVVSSNAQKVNGTVEDTNPNAAPWNASLLPKFSTAIDTKVDEDNDTGSMSNAAASNPQDVTISGTPNLSDKSPQDEHQDSNYNTADEGTANPLASLSEVNNESDSVKQLQQDIQNFIDGVVAAQTVEEPELSEEELAKKAAKAEKVAAAKAAKKLRQAARRKAEFAAKIAGEEKDLEKPDEPSEIDKIEPEKTEEIEKTETPAAEDKEVDDTASGSFSNGFLELFVNALIDPERDLYNIETLERLWHFLQPKQSTRNKRRDPDANKRLLEVVFSKAREERLAEVTAMILAEITATTERELGKGEDADKLIAFRMRNYGWHRVYNQLGWESGRSSGLEPIEWSGEGEWAKSEAAARMRREWELLPCENANGPEPEGWEESHPQPVETPRAPAPVEALAPVGKPPSPKKAPVLRLVEAKGSKTGLKTAPKLKPFKKSPPPVKSTSVVAVAEPEKPKPIAPATDFPALPSKPKSSFPSVPQSKKNVFLAPRPSPVARITSWGLAVKNLNIGCTGDDKKTAASVKKSSLKGAEKKTPSPPCPASTEEPATSAQSASFPTFNPADFSAHPAMSLPAEWFELAIGPAKSLREYEITPASMSLLVRRLEEANPGLTLMGWPYPATAQGHSAFVMTVASAVVAERLIRNSVIHEGKLVSVRPLHCHRCNGNGHNEARCFYSGVRVMTAGACGSCEGKKTLSLQEEIVKLSS